MHGDGGLVAFEIRMLDQRRRSERHHRLGAIVFIGDVVADEIEWDQLRREKSAETEQLLGGRAFGRDLLDRQAERGGDARRIARAFRCPQDPAVDPLDIGLEARAGEPAEGAGVIERERQVAERGREPLRSGRIAALRAFLQERSRRLGAERIELDLDRLAAPIGPARGHQHSRAGGRQQIAQQVGRLDIVVDQQKRRPARRASCASAARAARSWLGSPASR